MSYEEDRCTLYVVIVLGKKLHGGGAKLNICLSWGKAGSHSIKLAIYTCICDFDLHNSYLPLSIPTMFLLFRLPRFVIIFERRYFLSYR